MKITVVGGSGFIGSNFIKRLIKLNNIKILNIDNLSKTFLSRNAYKINHKDYKFKKIDICNFNSLKKIIVNFNPNVIINFAAESHVDNSINDPIKCINSNIYGTYNLLEISRIIQNNNKKSKFKFIQVSTDEVYGSLSISDKPWTEKSKYFPNSPYSASKAASDHLVRAWNKTFDVPTIVTNCSNNYGPFQHPEKLIPKVIISCLNFKDIPIYGNGKNIRDWIYVEDHVEALIKLIKKGKEGENYNISSNYEMSNLALVKKICNIFNKINKKKNYTQLIKFVTDRPAHDFRYSLNINKIKNEINFKPKYNFDSGLKKTINWYIENSRYIKF